MGFWIELHCDINGDNCCNINQVWPQQMSSSSNDRVAKTMRDLKVEAVKRGWNYDRGPGWVCPNCAKTIDNVTWARIRRRRKTFNRKRETTNG